MSSCHVISSFLAGERPRERNKIFLNHVFDAPAVYEFVGGTRTSGLRTAHGDAIKIFLNRVPNEAATQDFVHGIRAPLLRTATWWRVERPAPQLRRDAIKKILNRAPAAPP